MSESALDVRMLDQKKWSEAFAVNIFTSDSLRPGRILVPMINYALGHLQLNI